MLIRCATCRKASEKPDKEIRRQMKCGRTLFYCSRGCSPKRRAQPVQRICPVCRKSFQSWNRKKAARFCSRACASAGSVTPLRHERARAVGLAAAHRLRHDVSLIASGLRSREARRYARVEKILVDGGIEHQFEFPLGRYIYDLCLFGRKLLVEFDGKYHLSQRQRLVDAQKEASAARLGWMVKRLAVNQGEVIPPEVLSPVLACPA